MDDLLDLTFDAAPVSANSNRQASSTTPALSSFTSRTSSPFLQGSSSANAARPNYNLAASTSSLGLRMNSAVPTRTTTPLQRPASAASKQDAFQSLFAMSASGSLSVPHSALSLAERQRKMDQEREDKERREKDAFNFESWGHAGANAVKTQMLHPAVAKPSLAPSQPVSRPSSAMAHPVPSVSAKSPSWDFDNLLAPRKAATPAQSSSPLSAPKPQDPWDMAIFDSALPVESNPRVNGNKRFDAAADEDVLGLLSKPVERESEVEAQRPRRTETSRSTSPPPHIIGQIVEMGFGPSQARQALAQTSTGVDVQAALEMLLANGHGQDRHDHDDERQEADRVAREREKRRRRREGPSRSAVGPSADKLPAEDGEVPFVDQADKILAQASAVGMSVFSKANSLWNVGKERAQKLYEERAALAAAPERGAREGKGKAVDGRPRWMLDAEAEAHASERSATTQRTPQSGKSRFVDSDDDERPPSQSTRMHVQLSAPPAGKRHPRQADLLGETPAEQGQAYRSPARRKPLAVAPKPPLSVASGRSTARPAAPAEPLQRRKYTRATASQVSASAAFKESGNSHFKLGAYDEALQAYTRALEALPTDHLLRVPLYTNRAAAYLKQGEHNSAIEDCTSAITLVGLDYHPAKEAPLDDDDAVKDVKLADGLIKALCKRASAYEMGEKWKQAKEDWHSAMSVSAAGVVFAAAGGANTRKMIGEGLARAGKMCSSLETPASQPSRASVPPKPRPAPKAKPLAPPPNPADSAGVAAMRAAASAAESEDDQRLRCKDSVDRRVEAWSKGKETNLRGLLASLDMVLDKDEPLWKDVKRPGMAELITDKQLKIGYMKVIGRLHPDKLNASNSSVEQRMIANSVFGILNDAWQTHSGA